MADSRISIAKDISTEVKGIMLVLMYILHFFCFPAWYIGGGVSYPNLQWMEGFQGHFQICIAGFTFLTGYFYFSSQKGTFRYIIKKWIDILIPYWFVICVLLIIGYITGNDFSSKTIILEFLALKNTIMPFGWYVSYYCIMIPALVYSVKLIKNDVILSVAGLLIPMALYYGVAHFVPNSVIIGTLSKFQVYFPITIAGFMSAKYCLFGKVDELLKNKILLKCIVSAGLIGVVFMEPTWLYGISINNIVFEMIRKVIRICSIPFFVYGIVSFLNVIPEKVRYPLELIGKYSTIMWFMHGIFFGCSKELFQPILYAPIVPVLVLLWGLVLNLLISIPIDHAAKLIRSKVKS